MAVTFHQLGKWGRLGNQMFEIASTIGIAKKNSVDYYFPEWQYQQYFKNQLPLVKMPKAKIIVREKAFHYEEIILDKTGFDYDLYGYFQSLKYWEHCKDQILNYFEFTNQIITSSHIYIVSKNIPLITCSSIHIRRGDYLNLLDYHTNLSLDYYKSAIDVIGKEKNYLIFSDDIEWCKQNFIGSNFHFCETNNEIMDLYLMSQCEHHIIANSSFSWWGAYLNQNPNSKVIAPQNWFGEKLKHDTRDLYLPNWILI